MKKLITVVAIASLLALAGCAQGQASPSASASSGSASAAGTEASSGSASAAGTEASSGSASASEASTAVESSSASETSASLRMSVGDMQFAVAPADTDAARALIEQLQAGPVTVSLHAYGGFEQVGPLPWGLPASDEQIATSPGDIMLYQGDQITVFIGSNSWAYTPLGSIEGATSETLLEAFGGDEAEITLSLA